MPRYLAWVDETDSGGVLISIVRPVGSGFMTRDAQRFHREGSVKAVVVYTDPHLSHPGLALLNAPKYKEPCGPPVVQVSSEIAFELERRAREGATLTVVAVTTRNLTRAFNVLAHVEGRGLDSRRWWSCASERGGGIALWLGIMEVLSAVWPSRTVLFLANTGHELGHHGLCTIPHDTHGSGCGGTCLDASWRQYRWTRT